MAPLETPTNQHTVAPLAFKIAAPLVKTNLGPSPGAADFAIGTLPSSAWYVCMTKPRQEAYAVSKLQEQGYQVYMPQMASWVRRAGQWRQQHKPMFPRYAFVRPEHAGQAIGPVRSTPGVTCMVRFGVVLAGLADARLAALRQVVDARNACLPQQPFVPGQQVVFAAGPLAGLQGIVSSVATERVTVLMQLLGQDQTVAVPYCPLTRQAFFSRPHAGGAPGSRAPLAWWHAACAAVLPVVRNAIRVMHCGSLPGQ